MQEFFCVLVCVLMYWTNEFMIRSPHWPSWQLARKCRCSAHLEVRRKEGSHGKCLRAVASLLHLHTVIAEQKQKWTDETCWYTIDSSSREQNSKRNSALVCHHYEIDIEQRKHRLEKKCTYWYWPGVSGQAHWAHLTNVSWTEKTHFSFSQLFG